MARAWFLLSRKKLVDQDAIANVATANADATYGQPEADLINELKTQMNLALQALRDAGIIKP